MNDMTDVNEPRVPHPATVAVLRFFEYEHLPLALQNISRPFGELANELASYLDGPELTVALRKLLEAKDCAVRAALPTPDRPVVAMPRTGYVPPEDLPGHGS